MKEPGSRSCRAFFYTPRHHGIDTTADPTRRHGIGGSAEHAGRCDANFGRRLRSGAAALRGNAARPGFFAAETD
jgi:hypothetical protein